jgi:hypothetical protein
MRLCVENVVISWIGLFKMVNFNNFMCLRVWNVMSLSTISDYFCMFTLLSDFYLEFYLDSSTQRCWMETISNVALILNAKPSQKQTTSFPYLPSGLIPSPSSLLAISWFLFHIHVSSFFLREKMSLAFIIFCLNLHKNSLQRSFPGTKKWKCHWFSPWFLRETTSFMLHNYF